MVTAYWQFTYRLFSHNLRPHRRKRDKIKWQLEGKHLQNDDDAFYLSSRTGKWMKVEIRWKIKWKSKWRNVLFDEWNVRSILNNFFWWVRVSVKPFFFFLKEEAFTCSLWHSINYVYIQRNSRKFDKWRIKFLCILYIRHELLCTYKSYVYIHGIFVYGIWEKKSRKTSLQNARACMCVCVILRNSSWGTL